MREDGGKGQDWSPCVFLQDLFRSWIKDLGLEPPTLPIEFFSFFLCSDSFPHVVFVFWIKYWPLVRKCLLSCFLEAAFAENVPLCHSSVASQQAQNHILWILFSKIISLLWKHTWEFSGVPSFFLFAPCSLLHDIPVVFFWWTNNWDRWRNGLVRDPSTDRKSVV